MKKLSDLLIFSLIITGCVEPFQFEIEENRPILVIESSISDVSYIESFEYPSDGRYFTTKLRYGQIIQGQGYPVTGALVRLVSDTGEDWLFTPSENESGTYQLLIPDFKAIQGTRYKIDVTLTNNDHFESEWEMLEHNYGEMGDVAFVEDEKLALKFRYVGEEPVITKVRGVQITTEIPENNSSEKRFYKWTFEPIWIFIAGRLNPWEREYKCWVKGTSYLSQYTIGEDLSGGYEKELLFINTDNNDRLFEDFSILVKQYSIGEGYYNFLRELQDQNSSNGIFDGPPYNLKTNYYSTNSETPVFGYFSVNHEEARRIYFSIRDLSYFINKYTCRSYPAFSFVPETCWNCLAYEGGGEPSLSKPSWWHH